LAHSVAAVLSDPPSFPLEETRPFTFNVRHPKICITKECVNGTCENGIIDFDGTVLNCGDQPFVNINVTDVVDGAPTVITNVAGPLAAGGSFSYSGSYVSSHTPNTNFVTVTATAT
jgi:hypothetical protein